MKFRVGVIREVCLAGLLVCLTGCGIEAAAPEAGAQAGKGAGAVARPARVVLVWPTPNQAFARGEAVEAFLQPTASGRASSGGFGSVRNGGRRFHEGLDLKPVGRDAKGEATDTIFAAMAGVVRHISDRPGASNYGRYVVLEHPKESPPVYTLYAHLADIASGITVGREVDAGAALGVMGRSTSGEPIPKERAHLHFEIGVRITDAFAGWYRERGFGSANTQGLWNGMNLAGIDPLEVFTWAREGRLRALDEVFAATPSAVTVRVANAAVPDFVKRYPSLAAGGMKGVNGNGAGWEIGFAVSGAPIRWRRLEAKDLIGYKRGEVRVVSVDQEVLRENPARKLARAAKGGYVPGEDVETILGQLF